MDIEGTVKLIFPVQEFGSGFKKREFVITTKEQYPSDVKFEATKDKIEMVGHLKPGDQVRVHFNLRGNEYQGKYYVNVQAWKIDPLGKSVSPVENTIESGPTHSVSDDVVEDDLPF